MWPDANMSICRYICALTAALVDVDMSSVCRRGEDALRRTGLGYTIVRPGPLLEEPGGYKALVFDQGNRITQSISIADVADVSLKVRGVCTSYHTVPRALCCRLPPQPCRSSRICEGAGTI